MKNSLNISVAGEDLISTVDDSTNRLFINGTEVPSTSWTGSGTYSTTVQGHAITITQVEDTTGNVAIRRTAAYTYELYKIKIGTTIDGDLNVTGSIYEGGVKLDDKYGGNAPTLLWSNPNPGSSFNGQTIALSDSSDNYDILVFVSSYQGINTRMHSDIVKTGVSNFTITAFKDSTTATSSDTTIVWRNVTVSGSSVTINNGMYNAASSGGYNRADICIPTYIYGVQFKGPKGDRGDPGSPGVNYYYGGDTYTVVSTASGEPYALIIGGLLTSATKSIYFTIQTPKSMAVVNPSITSLRINPRHSDGGYMIGSSYVSGGTQVVGVSGYTVTAHKTDDYHITITINRSSIYNGTNNTPCAVQVDELIISFS